MIDFSTKAVKLSANLVGRFLIYVRQWLSDGAVTFIWQVLETVDSRIVNVLYMYFLGNDDEEDAVASADCSSRGTSEETDEQLSESLSKHVSSALV